MAWFALNKQSKVLISAVFLVAAAVILIGYYRRPSALPDSLNFVCVQTGKVYQIDRSKLVQIPAKNPDTGDMTLLPCSRENGVTKVSSRYRGALKDLGDKNRVVDAETLIVRNSP